MYIRNIIRSIRLPPSTEIAFKVVQGYASTSAGGQETLRQSETPQLQWAGPPNEVSSRAGRRRSSTSPTTRRFGGASVRLVASVVRTSDRGDHLI